MNEHILDAQSLPVFQFGDADEFEVLMAVNDLGEVVGARGVFDRSAGGGSDDVRDVVIWSRPTTLPPTVVSPPEVMFRSPCGLAEGGEVGSG